MNEYKGKFHSREDGGSQLVLRIKDRHGHFLAEIVYDKSRGYVLRIYCRKCKAFHEIEIKEIRDSGV